MEFSSRILERMDWTKTAGQLRSSSERQAEISRSSWLRLVDIALMVDLIMFLENPVQAFWISAR